MMKRPKRITQFPNKTSINIMLSQIQCDGVRCSRICLRSARQLRQSKSDSIILYRQCYAIDRFKQCLRIRRKTSHLTILCRKKHAPRVSSPCIQVYLTCSSLSYVVTGCRGRGTSKILGFVPISSYIYKSCLMSHETDTAFPT